MTSAATPLPDPDSPQTGTPCPVPPEQRPLQEYAQLCSSWFFRWPTGGLLALARPLAVSWLLVFSLCVRERRSVSEKSGITGPSASCGRAVGRI
ncbi:MAG: CGLD27 family protein, partial [bacterium]